MRDVMFRAWDRVQKKMTYYVNVYSEGDEWWWSADHVNPDTGDTICSFDDRAGDVMQYSTVDDDEGNRVFQSDIVYIHGPVTMPRGLVVFKEGAFIISHKEIYNRIAYTPLPFYPLTISGNIYEQPELMK